MKLIRGFFSFDRFEIEETRIKNEEARLVRRTIGSRGRDAPIPYFQLEKNIRLIRKICGEKTINPNQETN